MNGEKSKVSKAVLANFCISVPVGASDTATNQIQGGIIAGLVDAFAIADDTLNEIDNLAVLITQKFNEINMTGLNLDGKKGTQMFTVSSLKAVENPTNRSNVGVAVFILLPCTSTIQWLYCMCII